MAKWRKDRRAENVDKASTRNFGAAPEMDLRLVSTDGERAKFLRALLEEKGPLTIRQLADAWVDLQEVKDRVEANRVWRSVGLWVRKRVKAGELEQKGDSGDEHGSILYGFREGWIP